MNPTLQTTGCAPACRAMRGASIAPGGASRGIISRENLRHLIALAGLVLAVHHAWGQHGHLNAGALGTAQGDALYFANGSIFAVESGYVKELTFTNSGTYAGFYQGNISLTALPATINNGGPVPNAPAPGSFVETRIESVTGPAGGTFNFWEDGATSPTIGLATGSVTPSMLWPLSDASLGAGQPGADPFGHLHGRRFTADVAGTYTVGFRLFDTSMNGADGGPIHAPSETLFINFAAVPEPGPAALLALAALGLGTICLAEKRLDFTRGFPCGAGGGVLAPPADRQHKRKKGKK